MVHLRACSLMERVERLECLDRLSRDIASPASFGPGGQQLDCQRDHFAHRLYADCHRHQFFPRWPQQLIDGPLDSLPQRPH